MPTAGIINGTNIGLYIGGSKVAHGTSHTLDFSMNTRDITTKDTAGWSAFATGLKAATITAEHLVAFDATTGMQTIFNAFKDGTEVAVKFSTAVTGDQEFSGTFVITAMNITAGNQENTAFSATLQNVGAVTMGAVA